MTAATGNAMALRLAVASLVKRYDLTPPSFTPIALGPPVNHDITREGYASPVTVDREFTKFAANCWTPFKSEIPVLYRHHQDQPAGRLEEIHVDDKGLFARVRVFHAEAKRAPYFSVAASIHSWRIVNGDRPHAEITSATLDEISLVPSNPGNPDALAQRPPATTEFYDIVARGINVMIRMVDIIKTMNLQWSTEARQGAHLEKVREQLTITAGAPKIYGPYPARPRSARSPSQFSQLVSQLDRG